MSKILVLGAFGYRNNQLDGQTVKTRNVFQLIQKRYCGKASKMDTLDFRKKPWIALRLIYHLVTCKTLVIIPCLNNLTYIFPITYILSKVFRYRIVSICIGGWQIEYFNGNERFKPHPMQLRMSRNIMAFLPEQENVNKELTEKYGFRNSEVFPNFRFFKHTDITRNNIDPIKLVFMARINKQKGIPAITQSLHELTEQGVPFSMTYYGPIESTYSDEFNKMLEEDSKFVCYGGVLKPEDVQKTLMNYDVLLLPTAYYTEGFPGSILDAYIAGIPVIVTEWKHAHEFVKNEVSGFIVPFDYGTDEIVEKIKLLSEKRNLLQKMKKNAQMESQKYSEEEAWKILSKYI